LPPFAGPARSNWISGLWFDGMPFFMFSVRWSNHWPMLTFGATCRPFTSYGGESRL
jgi:hypothetical protein